MLAKFQQLRAHPEYKTEFDEEGFLLARDLQRSRPDVRQQKLLRLERYHDYYFGGDLFTPEERALYPLLAQHTNMRGTDGVEILERFEGDRGFRVFHRGAGQEFEVVAKSREELLQVARQVEGQVELDRYRPSPERLQRLTSGPLGRIRQVLAVSRSQLEVLRGIQDLDKTDLEAHLAKLESAESQLARMQEQLGDWDGGDATALREQATELADSLKAITPGSRERLAWWNSHDAFRGDMLQRGLSSLDQFLKTTAKEPAPPGWQPPEISLE